MKRYSGTETVEAGFYFNPRELCFRSLAEGGRLPGVETDAYYRVPTLALLVVGPLLGLAFVIFLPLVGIVMLGAVAFRKLGALAGDVVRAGARLVRPAWHPAAAFFSRGRPARSRERRKDEWAEDVKKKLDDAGAKAPEAAEGPEEDRPSRR